MIDNSDWRLIEALHDIQEALSALTFFMDAPDRLSEVERRRFRCFHDMMVVSYWRPFSSSNVLPKLSFKKIGLEPSSDEDGLHKRLGDYRNKLVAHTDADRMRVVVKAKKMGLADDGLPLWPAIDRDRGFEFLNDQYQLQGWLWKIRHHLNERVFDLVQALPAEVVFERDYLKDGRTDPPK